MYAIDIISFMILFFKLDKGPYRIGTYVAKVAE